MMRTEDKRVAARALALHGEILAGNWPEAAGELERLSHLLSAEADVEDEDARARELWAMAQEQAQDWGVF